MGWEEGQAGDLSRPSFSLAPQPPDCTARGCLSPNLCAEEPASCVRTCDREAMAAGGRAHLCQLLNQDVFGDIVLTLSLCEKIIYVKFTKNISSPLGKPAKHSTKIY